MANFKESLKNLLVPDRKSWTPTKVNSKRKIKLTPLENGDSNVEDAFSNTVSLPFAASEAFEATATIERRIDRPDGKTILSLLLQGEEISALNYEPGDTVGILTENTDSSVNLILKQIGRQESADTSYTITNEDSKKPYLPKTSTLRTIFKKFVNFKSIPLKLAIAQLSQYTENEDEKNILEFLSSKEGSEEYKKRILETGTSFLELLLTFSSCRPTPEVLIEILPRLLPRPYSIASSKVTSGLRLCLSVLPKDKEGLCTGMIRRGFEECDSLSLVVFLRKSHGFRMPDAETCPLVLIGPGTGVAPFLGFLEHLHQKNARRQVYLFTGYRSKEEFMYEEELQKYVASGVLTKLFVSFSREAHSRTKYVQDSLKEEWSLVGDAILQNNGFIYECGDYKKMEFTVSDALAFIVAKHSDINQEEATEKVKELKARKRYLQDIWY